LTTSHTRILLEISDPHLSAQLEPFAIEQATDLYTATKDADFSLIEMKIVKLEAALAAHKEFRTLRALHRTLAVRFAAVVIIILGALVASSPYLGLSTETMVPLIRIPLPIIIWSAIGSLGAMLYRFNNSAEAELADPLRWSFTRPLTGVLMGIIAYMTFKIGLLVLQSGMPQGGTAGIVAPQEFFWLAAFLAGFSDRFADSVLRSLAGRLGGDRQAELQTAEQTQASTASTGAAMKALADRLGWGQPLQDYPAISQTILAEPRVVAELPAVPSPEKSPKKERKTRRTVRSRDPASKVTPPEPTTVVAFPDNTPKEST
jgi:hypothetical protein